MWAAEQEDAEADGRSPDAMGRQAVRQCPWFGRVKRKSIIVSKSKEMVDLTMGLFAKFWVNGNQDALLGRVCKFTPIRP
jgi:hypothetical protein